MTVVTHETIPAFTFHYASTLSGGSRNSLSDRTHLHSTMLLLYRFTTRDDGLNTIIYIPLCFYFISAAFLVEVSDLYLHSTMLLLYPKNRFLFMDINLIYIPLCFYFIRYPLSFVRSDVYLHSTMLLLYLKSCDHFGDYIKFTFHYASTLSSAC